MRKLSILLIFSLRLSAQTAMSAATGEEFSLALYNDIHTDNTAGAWTNSVDWLLGANGRGPGGVSAISRWNVKAIGGVGDYTTACSSCGSSCTTAMATFTTEYNRIAALGLPGVWPQGNHDLCLYGNIWASTNQSATLDVTTSIGTIKLGFIGVGMADNMASGQTSRIYADGVIAAEDAHRQWMVARHVMTYSPQLNSPPYWQNAPGFCSNSTQCAGFSSPLDGVSFRDNFLVQEPRIFWAFGGHSGYTVNIQTTANDGHIINTTGNQGASGGTPGYITIMKFKPNAANPSASTIDVQVWLSYNGVTGTPYTNVFTWDWIPDISTSLSHINIRGVTNTQAVIDYTAPDTGACTVEVSESNTYSPVVNDVNSTLFTGANSDGGGSVTRTFIVGKRLTETAIDGKNYSRALQAYTPHYYRITCGAIAATGTFTTSNIPFQVTWQDIPQPDPTLPYMSLMPTLSTTDRTQTIVDPRTGALIYRVSLPADSLLSGSSNGVYGPYMYSGGFVRVCDMNLRGPGPGYVCSFAQGDGGYGSFYYIIPSTHESRYLGRAYWNPGAFPYMNPTDGKVYNQIGNGVTSFFYNGTFAAVAAGVTVSMAETVVISDMGAAVNAFDSTFDNTKFFCSPSPAIGDFVVMECRRGVKDTYGWVAVFRISTGAVVAATRVDSNIKCRWCMIHATESIYDQAAVFIGTHEAVGQSPPLGGGPYITTYNGGVTLPAGSTVVSVTGEPACAGCGADTEVATAKVGDDFRFNDGNTEVVRIVTKTSPTSWIVTPTTQPHATGTGLAAQCSYTPIYWKFLADPHGTDATNTNFIADPYWPIGGHDDTVTGVRLAESDGWALVTGDLLTKLGTPLTRSITSSPTFAGALGNCFGNGCKRHPSAGTPGGDWLTDYQGWDGMAYYDMTITPITGSLYKFGSGSYPLHRKYLATGAGQWGPYRDVSGPGATLATDNTDNYKYCVANAANECHAGSAKGDIYFNLPANPGSCTGANSACITNYNAWVQAVVQIGLDGSHTRVITGGLTEYRNTIDYPTAKTLPDGSHLLFTVGNLYNGGTHMMLAKLPPFTGTDSVDRTKFVSKPITLTNPGGGATRAAIKMGYLEQGTASQYYCTSRHEACIVTSTSAPPTDGTTEPFWFQTTDSWTGTSCATNCTIVLPVLPLHLAYYQPIFLDNAGNIVSTGAAAVTGDFVGTTLTPPTTGLHLLPTPIRVQ